MFQDCVEVHMQHIQQGLRLVVIFLNIDDNHIDIDFDIQQGLMLVMILLNEIDILGTDNYR